MDKDGSKSCFGWCNFKNLINNCILEQMDLWVVKKLKRCFDSEHIKKRVAICDLEPLNLIPGLSTQLGDVMAGALSASSETP